MLHKPVSFDSRDALSLEVHECVHACALECMHVCKHRCTHQRLSCLLPLALGIQTSATSSYFTWVLGIEVKSSCALALNYLIDINSSDYIL